MGSFFNLDGPFYRFGSMLADVLVLNVLWLIFSLPLVTVGASTSALFYVTTRRISHREGYIVRDFWTGFKANFKKATLLWLLQVMLVGILILNIFNIEVVGDLAVFLFPCQIVFLIEITLVSIYLFPITSRFEMKLTQILKSAFYMANRHIFTSITCVVLGAAIILGMWLYPILLLGAMGLYAWLASYLIMRVFKKYRPEMDEDYMPEMKEEAHGQNP